MNMNRQKAAKPAARLTALLLTLAVAVSLITPAAAADSATAAAVRLSKTEGTVKISKSSGKSVSLRNNMRLYSGYHVVTSAKSYAWIDLDDVKLIKEDASSETEVRKSGKKLEVNVVSGQVLFNVAESLKEDETLNISTSTMVVGIRGTTGWVRVMDRWKTEVCLLEGTAQCVVTDPVTGQLKTAVLRGGDVAECIVYPQDKAGDKCDITMKKQTVDGIPGYALTDLVRDVPLCDEILKDSGLDILGDLAQSGGGPEDGRAPGGSSASQEVIREAEKRQEQEEVQTGQKLEEIRQEVSEQDNNVSQTGVWGKDNTTTTPSGSGGGSGSSSTPAASGTMKLTDVQVQALLNGANRITVQANTDAADTTANKNLLEIDNGLSVAAGKTLTLDSGVDVAVRPGKTLQVDGTLHTSGNLTDAGTVNVTSGDTLRVGGDLTLEGSSGTLNVSATGRVVVDGTLNILTGGILQPQASTAVVMAKGFSGGGGVIGLPAGWKISATTDSEGYYHLLPPYIISYDANGGTLGVEAGGNTPVGTSTNSDGTINVSSIPTPTHPKANHSFRGWYLKKDISETDAPVTDTTVFTSDATIYAQWAVAIYSITFDLNGGIWNGTTANPGGDTDEDGKISGPLPTPTRDGYTFAGWFTDPTGGTQVTADTVFTANATVYARWGATPTGRYQITFNYNYPDGSSSPTALKTTNDTDRVADWPTDPSLSPAEGQYTFKGWFTDVTGGTQVGIDESGNSPVFTQNTALYAHWDGWGYDTTTKTLTVAGDTAATDYVDTAAPWASYTSELTSVTIAPGPNRIGNRAFRDCTALTSVTIPDTVTGIASTPAIGSAAFNGCTSLNNVTIPGSATTIGTSAFSGCTGLTDLTLSNGIETISNASFAGTGLTSVTIPSSVTSIETLAFQNCTSLQTVDMQFAQITAIENATFQDCTALTSVTIPNSVKSIGTSAFKNTALTSITIPDQVHTIWQEAFSGTKLINIIIPASVQLINNEAFEDCKDLRTVTFAENGVLKNIGIYAFHNCTSLTSIEIPNTVSSIMENTFTNCSSLVEIKIPVSVRSIGIGAFSGCTVLNIINYGGTAEQWNTITTPTGATGLEGKQITCTDGTITDS